ncbi:MAG TPA: hypothetical protein VN368_02115 [Candidatus Methylomirabilis sp.]|nr:hypothetical protein [Candidatus Methylomirabilis sp.]
MKYSRGDIVEFKVGSDETHKGQVQFVEKNYNEEILYVDSFSGWAYKVPEKRVVSLVPIKNLYKERERFTINKTIFNSISV